MEAAQHLRRGDYEPTYPAFVPILRCGITTATRSGANIVTPANWGLCEVGDACLYFGRNLLVISAIAAPKRDIYPELERPV
jgi:hypothetical protein